MDKVKEIDTIIDEIETTTDYKKKIDLINYTKVKIDKETDRVNEIIDEIKNLEPKKHKLYKKYSISELKDLYDTSDLEDKLKILQHISYINNKNESKLFNVDI